MFKTNDFIEFIRHEFPGTMDTAFNRDMAENAINYVEKVASEYDDGWMEEFIQGILEIFPEVTRGEVLNYFDDEEA